MCMPSSSSLSGRTKITSKALKIDLSTTRSQVRGAWDPRSQAYIMRTDQLPFFVDPDWSLEPDRAVVGGGGYSVCPARPLAR